MAFSFATPEDMPIKDRLLPSDVGFVLRSMGVFGEDNAVPLPVLLPGIVTMKSWTEAKAKAAVKLLDKNGKLAAYKTDAGLFCLVETSEEIPFG